MVSRTICLTLALCTLLLLGGCPVPPATGNGNSANSNGSASNQNSGGSVTNVNGIDNGGGAANANSPAGANQNATNENANGAPANANGGTNANGTENTNAFGNQNTNANAGTLSDADRAAAQGVALRLKQAMLIPAMLQPFVQPPDLDFDDLSNPEIGSTLSGCPVVSWVAGSVGFFGLVYSERTTPPCPAASADGRGIQGTIELRNYDRTSQRGTLAATNLLADGVPLALSGDASVTGGGLSPVLMNGSVVFMAGDVVLEGPLALELRRSGVVLINSAGATLRDSAQTFSVGLENLQLSVAANGSLTPISGAAIVNRGAEQAIRIEFSAQSAADGTIVVTVSGAPSATIQIGALAG